MASLVPSRSGISRSEVSSGERSRGKRLGQTLEFGEEDAEILASATLDSECESVFLWLTYAVRIFFRGSLDSNLTFFPSIFVPALSSSYVRLTPASLFGAAEGPDGGAAGG